MIDKIEIKKEIFRKSIHLCGAFIPFFLKKDFWLIIILLLLVCVIYFISELLRLKNIRMPIVSHITIFASRKRDENKVSLGPITLVLGIVLASILLPLNYATAGIFALSFGDGFASLVGKIFGKIKISHTGGKTLEGSLACFFAVAISVSLLTKNILLGFLTGLFAMLIEILPLLDFDNLIIPVFTGFFLQFLCNIFNYSFVF